MMLSLLFEKLDNEIKSNTKIINEQQIQYLALPSNNIREPNLIFIDDYKYFLNLPTNTKMILTSSKILPLLPVKSDLGYILNDNPKKLFFLLHNILSNNPNYQIKKFKSIISKKILKGKTTIISKLNVIIEDNVILEDNVIVNPNVIIKKNSIIRSGSIIGGTGFEFKRNGNDYFAVSHLGSVVINEDVEIQHNCVIDKAIFPHDSTVINKNAKLDNFVHIAHAVKIGKSTLIAAGAIIAGRTVIGDNCWIGPGVVVSNGLMIGDNSRVNLGSVLINDLNPNSSFSGNFAIDHKIHMNNMIKFKKGI